jgi:hypothetical protein
MSFKPPPCVLCISRSRSRVVDEPVVKSIPVDMTTNARSFEMRVREWGDHFFLTIRSSLLNQTNIPLKCLELQRPPSPVPISSPTSDRRLPLLLLHLLSHYHLLLLPPKRQGRRPRRSLRTTVVDKSDHGPRKSIFNYSRKSSKPAAESRLGKEQWRVELPISVIKLGCKSLTFASLG